MNRKISEKKVVSIMLAFGEGKSFCSEIILVMNGTLFDFILFCGRLNYYLAFIILFDGKWGFRWFKKTFFRRFSTVHSCGVSVSIFNRCDADFDTKIWNLRNFHVVVCVWIFFFVLVWELYVCMGITHWVSKFILEFELLIFDRFQSKIAHLNQFFSSSR